MDWIHVNSSDTHLLGKQLLVGVTYLDHRGTLIRQEQFCGPIVDVRDNAIVIERTDNGEFVSLPPGLQSAKPGKYRLRSTDEIVIDPDYIAKWEHKEPPPDTD